MDNLEYRGLGSMEYKRDPRDNKYYMIEPTVGRADLQSGIADINGLNIPLIAYFDILGLSENVHTKKKKKAVLHGCMKKGRCDRFFSI